MSNYRIERKGLALLGFLIGFVFVVSTFFTSVWAADPPALQDLSGKERERVAKLIEGAKKEGEVVWFSHSVNPELAVRIEKGFREYYGIEDFKLRHSLMRTGPLAARVLKSLQAGIKDIDIIHTSDFELFRDLRKRNLLIEYNSPEYAHYDPVATQGNGPIASDPGYFTSAITIYVGVGYNTKYVKELRSYEDILDPKYRGRIVVADASKAATWLYTFMGLSEKLPADYWKRLAAQKPALIVSARDIINRVGAGEYWIAPFIHARHVYLGSKRGLPVALMPPQKDVGVVIMGYMMSILSTSTRPNASKLMTDYFHSREIQQMLVEKMAFTPSRLDVKSTDTIRKYSPLLKELPELIPFPWKTVTKTELKKWRDKFRDIFY